MVVCNLVALTTLQFLAANVRHQGHEASTLDCFGHGVLAGCLATCLAPADDAAMAIGQLAEHIQIFVIDEHGPRSLTIDKDGIPLSNFLGDFSFLKSGRSWGFHGETFLIGLWGSVDGNPLF